MIKIQEAYDSDDYKYTDEEIQEFWSRRCNDIPNLSRIGDILVKTADYLFSKGLKDYFLEDLLPQLIDEGRKFGISSEDLEIVDRFLRGESNLASYIWK